MRRSFFRLGALALAGLFVGLAAHAPRAEALSCISYVPPDHIGDADHPISRYELLWGVGSWEVTVEGSTLSLGRHSHISTRDKGPWETVHLWAPDPAPEPTQRYVVKSNLYERFRFSPTDAPPRESSYAVLVEVRGSSVRLRLEGLGLLLVDTQHGQEFDELRLDGIVDGFDANAPDAPGLGIPLGYKDCEQRGISATPGSTLDLSVGIVRIDGTFLGWERRSIDIPELEEPGGCRCIHGQPWRGSVGLLALLLAMFLVVGRRSEGASVMVR
ncbi:MAG: hypothetical protein IPG45_29050 [Deltaproteobacteria bacterium]|nr:hypothetical protein [Deltaproteobacteria bacterium]